MITYSFKQNAATSIEWRFDVLQIPSAEDVKFSDSCLKLDFPTVDPKTERTTFSGISNLGFLSSKFHAKSKNSAWKAMHFGGKRPIFLVWVSTGYLWVFYGLNMGS